MSIKKKLVVTITAEIELQDDWYDDPLSEIPNEQIIETEKDQVHEWFFDYIKNEDWKIIEVEHSWEKYRGVYQKTHYDIKLKNAKTYEMCFPNAGVFCTLTGDEIMGDNVEYFKESKYHPMEIEE